MHKQVLLNKRLAKAYRKSFATQNPFPTFAFYGYTKNPEPEVSGNQATDQPDSTTLLGGMEVTKRPRLTLYGEINEQELFVSQ